ncbi:MAG TPA: energy transducer TonB [Pyrinomonadaceae bacterium]
MKIILPVIFITLFSSVVSAQTKSVKATTLSSRKTKVKIIKREFPEVPEKVRDNHARGIIRVLVFVNEEGTVGKANLISFNYYRHLNDYIEKTVADWKFEPRVIDEKNVSFKTVIEIPFCYGSFTSWCFY